MSLNKLGYFFVIQAVRISVAVIFVISLLLFYLIEHPSIANVYAVDVADKSKKHSLQTINYPGENIVFIHKWINDSFVSLFNFTYLDYSEKLNAMRGRFSSSGFSDFRSVFLASPLLATAISNKSRVSSVVDVNQVRNPGGFVFVRDNEWETQVPLFFSSSFSGQSSEQLQSENIKIATMRIVEVPAIEAPLSGLKIESVSLSKQ